MRPGFELVDQYGKSYGIKQIDGKPRVSSSPYTYDIAEGNVTGHTNWSKIGFNSAVTTEQDIAPWLAAGSTPALIYSFPASPLTMTISSSSAEDDPDKPGAGTGAHTVTVYYLNEAYREVSVTVTMDGANPVTIATDIYRIQNARVATAGTTLAAVGNLTIASGASTYGYISATKTRMRQCVWTVPAGKTLYITQIAFSCGDQAASKYSRFTTRANYDEKSGLVLQRGLFMPYNEVLLNNTSFYRELNPPTKLPATTDLKVSCYANSAAAVSCSLRGWVEKK